MYGGLAIKLKLKLPNFRKRQLGQDVFSRTQSKLTLQYSALMSLLLLFFSIIIYSLLFVLIWHNQEDKLNKLLDAEITALQGPLFTEISEGKFNKPGQRPFELSTDQAFYYLIDQAGSPLIGAEIQKELSNQVLAQIRNGSFREQSLQKVQLQIDEGPLVIPKQSQIAQKNITYLIGQRPLYRDGQLVATLFAGKDVAFQSQLFTWLLAALVGITFLFLALVILFSRWMSRQAMVPVREAYERQQQFVADASHELRTPLSVLLASIETLEMEESTMKTPDEEWVFEGIKEEIHRMNRLASDLLLLARSDTGEMLMNRTWFDIAETAAQTVRRLRQIAENQQVDLILNAPSELNVFQDEEKIVQIIVIMMENAIKYTMPGGKVTLTVANPAEQVQNTLLIEICDTGIGIAEDELPRIFERFYRPDKSRSRQLGGHGLGLAIAKQIVNACGGTIAVQSQLGQGSSFIVELPAAPTAKP